MGKLRIGTLFSGIGTPEQSLKHLQVEHKTVFACEWDKYARITYLTNNQAPDNFYQDVKTLDATKYKDQVDILIAGFPCQAFSIAGKQLGFEDTRGTYFFDTAKAVKECSPKVFVFENVEGLISNDKPKTPNCLFKTYTWKQNIESNQNVFFNHNFLLERIYLKKQKEYIYSFKDREGVFLNKIFYKKGYPSFFNKSYDGHKKGIGKTLYTMEKVMLDLGYKSITWDIVNTKDYTIPQNRSRIYIVGFKDNVDFHFQEKQELKLRLKDMLEDYVDEKYLLNQELVSKYLETGTASNHKGSQAGKVADENDETFWTVNAGTHGYSMGYVKIDKKYHLPQERLETCLNSNHSAQRVYCPSGIAPTISAGSNGGGKEPVKMLYRTHTLNIKGNDSIKRIYSSDGLCPSLTTMQGGHREPKVSIEKEIIKLFDIPKEILNDNERQRRVYSPEGISPAVIARSDSAKNLQNTNSKVAIANGVIEIENDEVRAREAVAKGFTLATEGDSINISVPSSKTRRGRVGKQVAQTLDTACNQVVFSLNLRQPPKMPVDNDVSAMQIGNSLNFGNCTSNSGVAFTLRSSQCNGVIENKQQKYIFRKLTPRECFRLQGFDDSFIFPLKMSDTQLYKQAGNGMSRNILDMIFTQIFTCYAKHIENKEN